MKLPTTLAITVISLSAIVVGIVAATPAVHAQSASTGSGQALEIGPPVINLSADPGTTVKATISLRDVSSTSLFVTSAFNDFVASGEDGTPKILLEDGETSAYSMKEWVAPISTLTLKPREIKNLTLTINVPANASPGGYYGVVRFTGTPPELEGAGVSLAASLGSLILLKVNGDAKEALGIEEFFVSSNNTRGTLSNNTRGTLFEAAPLTFTERLKNTGNIQEQPSGLVTIKDMFGTVVATLPINQPPRDVLPDSIRKFEQPLDETVIGNKILFGLYHADLSVTYGSDKQTVTSSISFWVIPYTLIGIIIAGLIVAFFGLRYMIKRYNRHILKQANKHK